MENTALDFEGEIEFLKDLENGTGIFAPKKSEPHISEIRHSEQNYPLNDPPDEEYPLNGPCC